MFPEFDESDYMYLAFAIVFLLGAAYIAITGM